MAQQKEGNDEKEATGCKKGLLWTKSEAINIINDKAIVHTKKDWGWQQIGINHDIDLSKDKKTSWSIKMGMPHKDRADALVMVGIGTKGIISLQHRYTGQHMFGFDFYSHSGHHNQAKHEIKEDTLCWAPGDEIKVEFCNYHLSLYVNEEFVYKWKLKEYKKLREQQFVPSISLANGASCEFLGISYN